MGVDNSSHGDDDVLDLAHRMTFGSAQRSALPGPSLCTVYDHRSRHLKSLRSSHST